MNKISSIFTRFFTWITKGIFAFTIPVYVTVPQGVSYSIEDEDEEDEVKEEESGMCAGCGKYECEC